MKKPTKKHVIRTATPTYFFGAMKAADATHKRHGRARVVGKLPTSLDELRQPCAAQRDTLGYCCTRCRISWVGRTEPPPCVEKSS